MAKVKTVKKCQFGSKCYRKNAQHFKEFSHFSSEEDETPVRKKRKIEDFFNKTKLEESAAVPSSSKSIASDEKESTKSEGLVKEAPVSEDDLCDSPEEEVPPSPIDVKENIKSKFLVEMPGDFYHFWEFAKTINSKNPSNAFKSSLDLQLVGPFDILAKKCKKTNSKGKRPCYLRHWRYYYDPPEFLTVLRGDDTTQFHMGYFRDDPSELPVFVASNAAKDNGTIVPRGANIYAAVHWYIGEMIKKDRSKKTQLESLRSKLVTDAKKHDYSLELRTQEMKARDKKSVCKTFHNAGMVVPVDENEVGYREVPASVGDLKKVFKRISEAGSDAERDAAIDPLMEIIMLIQFANDECDYGEGLELGLDMFTYGSKQLHRQIMHLLPLAYQLLNRNAFGEIITAHLKNRKHSTDLSELD